MREQRAVEEEEVQTRRNVRLGNRKILKSRENEAIIFAQQRKHWTVFIRRN